MQSRLIGVSAVFLGSIWHYRNIERGPVRWEEPIVTTDELSGILSQLEEEGVRATTRE